MSVLEQVADIHIRHQGKKHDKQTNTITKHDNITQKGKIIYYFSFNLFYCINHNERYWTKYNTKNMNMIMSIETYYPSHDSYILDIS
jgi:hypothetical protein